MADPTLILLVNEVRSKTLRLIDGLSEDDARFAAPGMNNTILWHAGHAMVLVEHLSVAPLSDGKMSYPAGWFETFSWKSDPRAVTAWPTLAEVREKLIDQRERLIAALERTDEATLARIADAKGRPLRYSILHGLHDEAGHQGEIYLLKKMLAGR